MRYELIILLLTFYSCKQTERPGRIDIDGYITGESIDENWQLVRYWDELNEKYFQHKSDSFLTCRTIGDQNLIYVLSKGQLDSIQIRDFRTRIKNNLMLGSDSVYRDRVAGMFSCYQFSWIDTINSEEINIFNCKPIEVKNRSNWSGTIEIVNSELEERLKITLPNTM